MFMRTQISGKNLEWENFIRRVGIDYMRYAKKNGVIRTMARSIISSLTLLHS